ncbi:MAG: DNA polymerase III subunit delta [Shewanellaceae bacterium]|nr:DNA polymerase III subunit delta [Shewanellaceae bacterium]
MRVYPEQFLQQVQSTKPLFLVFGDEPWLIAEMKQQILTKLRGKGFQERICLEQDASFQWSEVRQHWQSIGLFASKKLIEVRLQDTKIGQECARLAQFVADNPNPDTCILITGPKLSADKTKAKWFKSLESQGYYIPCLTPVGTHFQRWLDARIQWHQLTLTQAAQAQLHAFCEGNLLAADQALLQMRLIAPETVIESTDIETWLLKQSKFSVFQLADALLQGNSARIVDVFQQLLREGTHATLLLWCVLSEAEKLQSLLFAHDRGQLTAKTWQQLKIWSQKQALYQQALQRLSMVELNQILCGAHQIEKLIKQEGRDVQASLLHLCLRFGCDATAVSWSPWLSWD